MALTGIYGDIRREDAITVVRRAFEAGIDHFDTAELYGPYANEELLADALGSNQRAVRIATKFGYKLHGGEIVGLDSAPHSIRRSVEGSLRRLGRECIDLIYQHRIDPCIPIEDVVGTMAELIREGKAAELGLCCVDGETLERAQKIHSIAAVQNEYSLIMRQPEREILPGLREDLTTLVAYSPLARGILGGDAVAAERRETGDYRRSDSRFSRACLESLQERLAPLWHIARQHQTAPAAVALAWILSKSPKVCAIPGARTPSQISTNLQALELHLSPTEIQRLDMICCPEQQIMSSDQLV